MHLMEVRVGNNDPVLQITGIANLCFDHRGADTQQWHWEAIVVTHSFNVASYTPPAEVISRVFKDPAP